MKNLFYSITFWLGILTIACSLACNNEGSNPGITEVDSTAVVREDSAAPVPDNVDTITVKADTAFHGPGLKPMPKPIFIPKPGKEAPDKPSVNKELRKALLGFSYYKTMLQGETRDLRVNVQINGTKPQVRQTIRNIEKEELKYSGIKDTSDICFVENIDAYNKLKITPVYDSADFTIVPFDTDEEQEIDFVKGNNWQWKVRAVAGTPHMAGITLRIHAETPEGQKVKLPPKQINIRIEIEEAAPSLSFWQKFVGWIDRQLGWLAPAVFIPGILIVYNRLKKKKRSPEKGDEQV
jgi:hypothetical protein